MILRTLPVSLCSSCKSISGLFFVGTHIYPIGCYPFLPTFLREDWGLKLGSFTYRQEGLNTPNRMEWIVQGQSGQSWISGSEYSQLIRCKRPECAKNLSKFLLKGELFNKKTERRRGCFWQDRLSPLSAHCDSLLLHSLNQKPGSKHMSKAQISFVPLLIIMGVK